MPTRVANTNDIGNIVDFLEEYHLLESNLQDIIFDRASMTQALNYYIGMPKHICFVYTDNDEVTGVLCGSIEPFMFNKKRNWATDLLNVAHKGGPWLLKRFFSWAEMHNVDRIFMGVSTGQSRSDELYKAMGLQPLGGMYGMNPKEHEASK